MDAILPAECFPLPCLRGGGRRRREDEEEEEEEGDEVLTTMQSYPESHGHFWHVSDSELSTLTEQVEGHGCDLAGLAFPISMLKGRG